MSSDPASEPPTPPEPAELPRWDVAIGPAVFRGLVGCLVVLAMLAASLVAFVATCGAVGLGLVSVARWSGASLLVVSTLIGLGVAWIVGVNLRRARRATPPATGPNRPPGPPYPRIRRSTDHDAAPPRY